MDAMVSSGFLTTMHRSGMVKLHSLEHIIQQARSNVRLNLYLHPLVRRGERFAHLCTKFGPSRENWLMP